MLSETLTPDMIRLKVPAKNWEEAIRAAGEPLVKAGKCEPRYVQAMIDTVYRVGPYMVLAPGLALPHARPEDGVLAVGVSLVTLAKPIEFGSQENDPVSLVIAFGNPDRISHINMLTQLAGLLGEETTRQKLSAAKSVKEVVDIIHQFDVANS